MLKSVSDASVSQIPYAAKVTRRSLIPSFPGQSHFKMREDYVLKGHGFSRAEAGAKERFWL